MSVLSVPINFVSRDIRIPSESLANALLRYMPQYDSEAWSALDLVLPS